MIYKVIRLNGFSFVEEVVKTFKRHNEAMEFLDKEQMKNPMHTYYLEEEKEGDIHEGS